ncbi:MAG: hydrogenase maturation protease [Actinomycetota bacterium]
MQTLVIGVGNPDRGDDAVGIEIARQVAEERPDVTVLEFDDPSEAIDAWEPDDTIVITDAVSSGGPPGEIHVVNAVLQKLPAGRWSAGGTHALGLAAAVEIARALGRMPRRLVVVGVEARHFGHGALMSDVVTDAVPAAVEAVLAAIDEPGGDS